ncbi:MAG: alpha/beta hydrolase [Ruminococcaceae bacterium]|nr:alpha/beta hydrolase [Oscillospiraceae bacterium]
MQWNIYWTIGLVLVLLSIGFYFFSVIFASYCIYTATLKRKDKDHWGRTISIRTELTEKMDAEGMAWQSAHDTFRKDVHILRNGLNLYGEYYDMGSDKVAMILSGRTESLRYGYYFAKPYADSGFNVLVIDPRAHGFSDGQYNTVGFEESRDALAWVRFLEENFQIKTVVFHGICIGAAAGMLAITADDCPSCVKGMVTEGMFANFGCSMRNHLIERKRLMWPVMQCIDFWMKHYTGHSMMRGPIDVIDKMDKPLLMIQSKMDKYSTPENARKLYDKCPSREKSLVLYETGDHSMLRITDTEKYDSAIKDFLARYFQ